MSYISRKRSYHLIQSNSIGILSSIAIHTLILGIVLPNINLFGDRTRADNSRMVKITQLNPTQLSRLPNFNPDPIAPSQPIKPKSSRQKSLTSIYPDLSKLEVKINQKSNFNSRSGLSNINITPLPLLVSAANKLPPPPPVIPSVKSLNPLRSTPSQHINQKPVKQVKIAPTPVSQSNSAAMDYPLTQSEIRDFRQRILQAKIRDRVNLITKDPTNTTEGEALQNYITWLLKIQQTEPETITISGTYPRDICARKLETTVIYGVSVNKIGQAIDLHLIKSSGYQIFDRQAEQEINSQTFKPQTDDNPTAYKISLNFQHSDRVCPGSIVSS